MSCYYYYVRTTIKAISFLPKRADGGKKIWESRGWRLRLLLLQLRAHVGKPDIQTGAPPLTSRKFPSPPSLLTPLLNSHHASPLKRSCERTVHFFFFRFSQHFISRKKKPLLMVVQRRAKNRRRLRGKIASSFAQNWLLVPTAACFFFSSLLTNNFSLHV